MPNDNPLHIAIIPDGNRRWAHERGLHPWEGHRKAIDVFKKIGDWGRDDPRIGIGTIWCFSTENWKRDPQEIAELMSMLEGYLRDERAQFKKNNVRFLHSGRRDRIPASLATIITEVEEETKHHTGKVTHLALDYGGKDELIRAMKKMKDTSGLTEESFRSFLDHPELPDIDLVIRTSGEHRTSNFFLWEAAYAEWEFVDKYFPDFTTDDLKNILDRFTSRTRRFGA